jgi:hypothetical protein
MQMSRKHYVALAIVLRDSPVIDKEQRAALASDFADAMQDDRFGARNFDRATFIAFATSQAVI